MTAHVIKGVPDILRRDVAALYWDAFGGKLGRVLGPTPLALRFLETAIRPDHGFVAVDARGALLGVAGFRSVAGSFAGGGKAELRQTYGLWGSAWRSGLLSLLESDTENQRFLLDGICVARTARGKGIGTQLLGALMQEARARHYHSVRLDVVNTNTRARALYERQGFVAVQTQSIGLLRFAFGFSGSTTMVCPVQR